MADKLCTSALWYDNEGFPLLACCLISNLVVIVLLLIDRATRALHSAHQKQQHHDGSEPGILSTTYSSSEEGRALPTFRLSRSTSPTSSSSSCSAADTHLHKADSLQQQVQNLTRDNERLIQENGVLSITIKNLSDEHTLLCEIRSTLHRQRRDSKESLSLLQQSVHPMHNGSFNDDDDDNDDDVKRTLNCTPPPHNHQRYSPEEEEERALAFKGNTLNKFGSKSETFLFAALQRTAKRRQEMRK